jgi:cell division protein FtsQ
MKKNWIKRIAVILLVLGLFPAVFLGGLYFLNQKGFFRIVEINWQLEKADIGDSFFSPKINELQFLLQQFVGQSLWEINLESFSSIIKTQDWIADHQVRKTWPARVLIEIKPKKIALIYVKRGGGYRPVTADGDLLAVTTNLKLPDKILLIGEVLEKNKDIRKKAIELYKSLPESGNISSAKVSEIRYDNQKGFQLVLIGNSAVVRLGEEMFEQKISRASQVLEYLDSKKLQARVIDANLSKKVLVRLRKAP